jgi:hypothetical protein
MGPPGRKPPFMPRPRFSELQLPWAPSAVQVSHSKSCATQQAGGLLLDEAAPPAAAATLGGQPPQAFKLTVCGEQAQQFLTVRLGT